MGYLPEVMGLDAGYHNATICKQLDEAKIKGVIGYRRHTHKGEQARYKGLPGMREQSFLTAAVQNMKKIAIALWRLGLVKAGNFAQYILTGICRQQSPLIAMMCGLC